MNYNVFSQVFYASYCSQRSVRTPLRKLEKTTTNQVGYGKTKKVYKFLINFCTFCQLGDKTRYWGFYRATAPNFCWGGSYLDHHLYELS